MFGYHRMGGFIDAFLMVNCWLLGRSLMVKNGQLSPLMVCYSYTMIGGLFLVKMIVMSYDIFQVEVVFIESAVTLVFITFIVYWH